MANHYISLSSRLIRQGDEEVRKLLGEPVHCFGDENSRRRRTLAHARYHNAATGQEHMRIAFSAEGPHNAADVIADVKVSSGALYSLVLQVPLTGEKLVYTSQGKFERRN